MSAKNTQARPLLIDKETRRFIRRLQPEAPVNVTAIAKVLGLQVWESHSLPEGIAGKLFLDEKNGGSRGYSIVVRAQDPLVRKRFTVAHEIGHYLMHRNLIGTEVTDDALYRSKLSTRIEAQANAFAAEILMPWHLLLPVIDKPLAELASLFQVSEQAMQIRLSAANQTSVASIAS